MVFHILFDRREYNCEMLLFGSISAALAADPARPCRRLSAIVLDAPGSHDGGVKWLTLFSSGGRFWWWWSRGGGAEITAGQSQRALKRAS